MLKFNKKDYKDFESFRKFQLLKNALYSAKIEGNSLEIEDFLLPRRKEVLISIREHSPCSADFLYRQFMIVPHSTIRFDLLQLQRQGLIKKLGTTRGALYTSTNTNEPRHRS